MALGERAVLEVVPSYGFKHKDCKWAPPAGVRPEDALTVDVQVGALRREVAVAGRTAPLCAE